MLIITFYHFFLIGKTVSSQYLWYEREFQRNSRCFISHSIGTIVILWVWTCVKWFPLVIVKIVLFSVSFLSQLTDFFRYLFFWTHKFAHVWSSYYNSTFWNFMENWSLLRYRVDITKIIPTTLLLIDQRYLHENWWKYVKLDVHEPIYGFGQTWSTVGFLCLLHWNS